VAYYARNDFFNNPELIERSVEVFRGKLSLDWAEVDTERVRCRPSHPERGLTFGDTNVGSYGWDAIPEKIRHNFSMAPRGAFMPEGLPHLGYDINRKSEVWSENCAELYEESKSRHWASTLVVPWEALEHREHPDDMERGLAQLYTDLTAMSTLLCDVPSKWVWHINHELMELKSWLCTQMFDAARLADVFRKRAIAGGTGLGHDHAPLEELLKGVLDSGTYPCASVAAYLALSGLMQALLRHIGAVSPNEADQTLIRLSLQDVSRFTAYGLDHSRCLLAVRPHEQINLEGHLEGIENLMVGLLGSPIMFSALCLVTAGGRDGAEGSAPQVVQLYQTIVNEHFERRADAGLGSKLDESPLARLLGELEG
jgi:hypothetical protein